MFKFIWKWFREPEKPSVAKQSYPKVFIARQVISESAHHLRKAKDEFSAHENILYWAGKSSADGWLLTTCIAPVATTTWGSYSTTSTENARVVKFLAENNLELLCQVHSHPAGSVGHSAGDDGGAFMPFENFLSIVVPHYGRKGVLPLTQCGIHRFRDGSFIRLSKQEVEETFSIVDDL